MYEYITKRYITNSFEFIFEILGSPYRDLISEAILKLQEDQILQMLYNKWWKQKGTQTCESDEGKKDASALAIANVGGVFVVLVAGLLLGLIVAFIEFIYKAHKNADIDRVSTRLTLD